MRCIEGPRSSKMYEGWNDTEYGTQSSTVNKDARDTCSWLYGMLMRHCLWETIYLVTLMR